MESIRILLATILLMFSGQALALFMPEGFKIGTDTTVATDDGCGAHASRVPVLQAQ